MDRHAIGDFKKPHGFCHRDRLDQEPCAAAAGARHKPVQTGGREVAVGDDEGSLCEDRLPGLEIMGRKPFGRRHVIDGGQKLALAIEKRQIGAGWVATDDEAIDIDTGAPRGAAEVVATLVIADPGNEGDIGAEQAEIVGDVAGDTAGRLAHPAGIGGGGDEGPIDPALDVDIGAADDDDPRHQKSVGAPPSVIRRATKSPSSSLMAVSRAGGS